MRTRKPKVTVLLAAFNGSSFLDDQLLSLSLQKNVEVEVYANDDGSTDKTLEILEKWKRKGLIVFISQTTNIGSTNVFLNLVNLCREKAYIAFCDQDDVWNLCKLSKQIELCEENIPTLVCSRREYFYTKDKKETFSPSLRNCPSFENALIENIAYGNTVLLNRPAIKIVNSYTSTNITHYDSWAYLLISAFGTCKFINEPLVKYRIHNANQVGLRKFNIKQFEKSALNFVSQAYSLFNQSQHKLPRKYQEVLTKFLAVLGRGSKIQKLTTVWKTRYKRQRLVDEIALKIVFSILVFKEKI